MNGNKFPHFTIFSASIFIDNYLYRVQGTFIGRNVGSVKKKVNNGVPRKGYFMIYMGITTPLTDKKAKNNLEEY